jgi:hypothetical protein
VNAWARAFRDQLRDQLTVEVRTGTGSRGAIYAQPVTVRGLNVRAERTLTRDAQGEEAVAELIVKAPPFLLDTENHEHEAETLLAPGSRITWRGRRGEILTASAKTWSGRTAYVEAATT